MSNIIIEDKIIKVAAVIDQYKVILNAGKNCALSVGDEFILYRSGDEIFDPDSGEALGILEIVVGKGAITHIQDRLSTLESIETIKGQRRLIRPNQYRNNFLALTGALGRAAEEIIEEPTEIKAFRDAQVGDFAKAAY